MDSKLKHLMTEWNYDQAVKLALPIVHCIIIVKTTREAS